MYDFSRLSKLVKNNENLKDGESLTLDIFQMEGLSSNFQVESKLCFFNRNVKILVEAVEILSGEEYSTLNKKEYSFNEENLKKAELQFEMMVLEIASKLD